MSLADVAELLNTFFIIVSRLCENVVSKVFELPIID